MKKPILLFDIDYTLFNTDIFRSTSLMEIAARCNLDEDAVRRFYAEYRKGTQGPMGINMKHFTTHIGNAFNLSPDFLFSIVMDTEKLYLDSLYPDTVSTLTLLSKEYTLGIFSQGYREFQENKLKQCGIMYYFKKEYIFIFPDKTVTSELKILPHNAVIIEDRLPVVQAIQPPLRVIHINRKEEVSTHTHAIANLSELPSVLMRLP